MFPTVSFVLRRGQNGAKQTGGGQEDSNRWPAHALKSGPWPPPPRASGSGVEAVLEDGSYFHLGNPRFPPSISGPLLRKHPSFASPLCASLGLSSHMDLWNIHISMWGKHPGGRFGWAYVIQGVLEHEWGGGIRLYIGDVPRGPGPRPNPRLLRRDGPHRGHRRAAGRGRTSRRVKPPAPGREWGAGLFLDCGGVQNTRQGVNRRGAFLAGELE